ASRRETGQARTAPVGADVHDKIGAVAVGAYDIKVEAASFQREVKTDLVLTVGQEAVLNFSLAVGAIAEAVTVQAEAPLVDTTSGSLGGLVDEQKVSELPLNGCSYTALVLLQPGIWLHRPASATSHLASGIVFSSNVAPAR